MAEPVPGRPPYWRRKNNNGPAPWLPEGLARGGNFDRTTVAMYERICAWDNLRLAYRKAATGKRGQPVVAAFEHRLEDNLLRLKRELEEETYQPGDYTSFHVHEPKRRLISAAPFRDRVVHHALCNVIEPVFERSFTGDSFANRKGMGTHRALDRAQEFLRRHRYLLSCDVRQFFPSIDHEILEAGLKRKIRDERTLRLVRKILAGGKDTLSGEYDRVWFPGDDLLARVRPRGLPIGNLTSQFWANCHLNGFDHFVKRELRCPGYVRYVDDFVLFHDSRTALLEAKERVRIRLAALRLAIHPGAEVRESRGGLSFLGFRLFAERRRLKARKGHHFRRTYRRGLAELKEKRRDVSSLNAKVLGWVNHVRFANTVGLRKDLLGFQRHQ